MSKSSVAIIDYGMGNLHSVASALEHVSPGSNIQVTADTDTILNADKVIFPGVGAIRDCMEEIRRLGFDKLVPEVVASGKPVLAICVGMQSLLDHSEENDGVEGLGLFTGHVRFFGNDAKDAQGQRLKVPHMGWNQVQQTIEHPLWQGIENNSRFYFVHSYYVKTTQTDCIAGKSEYGQPFSSALSRDNLFAAQFHPEKSHTVGLQLLKNFMVWNGQV